MSTPVLTFFNNKGGVGKTSLVFHVAWMFAEMGKRVVAVDLDPQANLTTAFLKEETLETLWDVDNQDPKRNATVYQCLKPLTEVGDILEPLTQTIAPQLHLVPGDLGLARFEDDLSLAWTAALGANPFRPFRLLSAFWQIAQMAARQHEADLVLVDVGPNLGALNRSALIATDHVIIPLAADLFSIQGLRNLGPTLTEWRGGWKRRLDNWPAPTFELPLGSMHPAGYVLMQHSERLSRPVKAFEKWAQRIPSTYLNDILDQESARPETVSDDVNCLALIKHYRSLVPMAQEARKPIFRLTSADGAIGNHSYAVRDSRTDFEKLALAILRATHLSVG